MNTLLDLSAKEPEDQKGSKTTGEIFETRSKDTSIGGLLMEGVHSAGYMGLQKPINGIVQLVDKAAGSNILPSLQIINQPEPAEFFSSKWHAQQVGNVAGMVPWFLVARKGAQGVMRNAGLSMEAAQLTKSGSGLINTYRGLAVTEGAMTGFIYDAAFNPVHESEGDFLTARLKHGAVGALTFGTLTAGSIGLNTFGRSLAEGTVARSIFTNPVAAGGLSSIPAGLVSAESSARIMQGRGATLEEHYQSAYTFMFIGTAASAAHAIPGRGLALVEKIASGEAPMSDLVGRGPKPKPLIDVVTEKGSELANRVDELAWSVNPLRPMEPAFAMAMADGGRGAVRPNADTMAGIMQMSRHQSESGSNTGNRGRVRRTTETKEESERPEQKERSAEAPVKAWRALEQYGQREVAEYVRNHPKLRNIEVKEEAIGVGNEAQVVLEVLPGKEFPEGAALKVVFPEGGWEHSNGKRVRDAKIYGKAHEIEEGGITSIVYFQELVDMLPRYEKEALDAYFADLDKAGLSFEDPGSNPNKQIGISRRTNQLVTVDYATVGEPGHRQFLTDFNYGREEFEAETDVFNPEARARSQEPVYDQNFDASKELAKQDLRHSKKLSETQREILDQLLMGISVKETAEYVGYIRAAAEGKTPDLKAMTLEVLQMEKMAKKQGLL